MVFMLGLMVLAVVTSAEKCTFPLEPPQWEAEIASTVTFRGRYGTENLLQGHYHIWFDVYRGKVFAKSTEDVTFNGQPYTQTHLLDYSKGIYYLGSNGTVCDKAPLEQFTMPESSKVSEGYQGLGENSMEITTYKVPFASPFHLSDASLYISITPDCIMTKQLFVGAGWMGLNEYYNVTLGAADASVFDTPPECATTDDGVKADKEEDKKKHKKYRTYKKKFSGSDMDKKKASLYSKTKLKKKTRVLPSEQGDKTKQKPDYRKYKAKIDTGKKNNHFSDSEKDKKDSKMKFSWRHSHNKRKDE